MPPFAVASSGACFSSVRPHAHAFQRAGEHHLFHDARGEVAATSSVSREAASSISSGRTTATTSCSRAVLGALGGRDRGAAPNCMPSRSLPRQQQVGRAEEGGDEARRRARVQLVGPAHLEQAPEVHDADAVGQRERLFLVVRHEHGGDPELALHLADGAAQFLADLGVERAEGLIEQQHLGLVRERARHRDALLLAAGELRRQALVHALRAPPAAAAPCAARGASRARSCAARAARTRCCPPRSCAGTARSSGTPARRRARARRRASRRARAARCGRDRRRSGPAMARSRVLLPLPLGPSSTKNSPSPMSSETSLTTGTPCSAW